MRDMSHHVVPSPKWMYDDYSAVCEDHDRGHEPYKKDFQPSCPSTAAGHRLCSVSETSISFSKKSYARISVQNLSGLEVNYAFKPPKYWPYYISASKGSIPAFGKIELAVWPHREFKIPQDVEFILLFKDTRGQEQSVLMHLHLSPGDIHRFASHKMLNVLRTHFNEEETAQVPCDAQKRHAVEQSVDLERERSLNVIEFYPVVVFCIGLYMLNVSIRIPYVSIYVRKPSLIYFFGFVFGFLAIKYIRSTMKRLVNSREAGLD
ncbi:uncharacterized protein LOC126315291 [Schistocerca gregaria]|uniref:uncharacterized protein LOC126315291 n=1 Tax=Schistocerca gregaria TaxID=7010 RepID=UPI00211EB338|nr:uncharacterized protein LOC126315291 [Schistocerca gregaria]